MRPDEADLAGREPGPAHMRIHRGMHRWRRLQVDVGRREHLRPVGQLGGVDLGDRGVRVLGPHERRPQRAVELQIVDVAALAGQKPWILPAANALPDHDCGSGPDGLDGFAGPGVLAAPSTQAMNTSWNGSRRYSPRRPPGTCRS